MNDGDVGVHRFNTFRIKDITVSIFLVLILSIIYCQSATAEPVRRQCDSVKRMAE
jgi:hypothetical protein